MQCGKRTYFGFSIGKAVAKQLDFQKNKKRLIVYGKGSFPGWGSNICWVEVDLFKLCIVRTFGQAKKGKSGRNYEYPHFSKNQIEEIFQVAIALSQKKRRKNKKRLKAKPPQGHQEALCERCQTEGRKCFS